MNQIPNMEVVNDIKSFKQVIDLSPFPMWVYDLESLRFLYVNDSAIRLYGYSREEFLSMTLKDIRPKEDVQLLLKAIDRLKSKAEKAPQRVYRHKAKDGRILYVHIKGNTIDYDGRPGELVSVIDLTDDREKDNKLLQQQLFLTTISEVNSYLLSCETIDEALSGTFELVASVAEIDSICYFKISSNSKHGQVYAIWKDHEFVVENPEKAPTIPVALLEKTREKIVIKAFDEALEVFKEHLYTNPETTKSLYLAPVQKEDSTGGYICFADYKKDRQWTSEEIKFFETVVSSVSQAVCNLQIKEELALSEKKFKSIVEKSNDLTAIMNRDGCYTYVSPTCEKKLGKPAKQLVGSYIYDLIDKSEVDYVRSKIEETLNEGSAQLRPFQVPTAYGHTILIEMQLTNMIDNPAVKGIVINAKDVTGQVSTEHELEIANERYRLASLASRDHIYDWDLASNHVERTGQSLKALFGYEEADWNKEGFWFPNIHPEDVGYVYESLKAVLEDQTKDRCILQYRFRGKNGNYHTIIDSGHIIRDKNGHAIRLVGTVRDISDSIREQRIKDVLHSLITIFSQAEPLRDSLKSALRTIVEETRFDICEIWLKSHDEPKLNRVEFFLKESMGLLAYSEKSNVSSFAKGKGLPGKVWEKQEAILWHSIDQTETEFVRADLVNDFKLKGALGVPIINNKEFLGVLVFLSTHNKGDFVNLKETITAMGQAIAPLLKQRLLEERNRQFQLISPDLHFSTNRDGLLKETNNTFLHVLGYSRESVSTMSIRDFVYSDDSQIIDQILLEPYKDQTNPIGYEIRLTTKTGDLVWVLLNMGYSVADDLLLFVGKDITEQKQVQSHLKRTNQRLKNAQELALIGYWRKDINTSHFEWSEETYGIYGYSKESFTPTVDNLHVTFHPDELELMNEWLKNIIKAEDNIQLEHRIITADNQLRWVYQKVHVVKNSSGLTRYMEGTIQDITERKDFEQQLALSNRRFQLAIHASNQIIWDYDPNSGIITRGGKSNFVFAEVEDYKHNNSWFERIHPDDKESSLKSFEQAMNSTDEVWQREYRILDKNNQVSYVIDRCAILRDKTGKPIRVVGSVMDITESKLRMKKIEEQNKSLREIAWIQSHVVRAPLARLMGYVALLNENEVESLSFDEIKKVILDSAKELDQIIGEISNKTTELK